MEKICDELGFKLSPVLAMLFPDYAMDHSEGRPLNPETQKVHDLMLLDLLLLALDANIIDLLLLVQVFLLVIHVLVQF